MVYYFVRCNRRKMKQIFKVQGFGFTGINPKSQYHLKDQEIKETYANPCKL